MTIQAALTIGDDVLTASDDPMSDSFGPVQGTTVSYDAADVTQAKRVFDALAEGGTITQGSSRPSSRKPSACASSGSARPG